MKLFFKASTGRPLTDEEVKAIRAVIEKNLSEVELVIEPESVISSMATERMRVMERSGVPLEQFLAKQVPTTLADAIKRFGIAPSMARAIQYAEQNTGIYLQGFTDSLQGVVTRTINNAMRTGATPADTARTLWRNFGNFNRDWRLISVTETAQNANNGMLLGVPVGGFVKGISKLDCCAWCRNHIDGRVFKVVAPPSKGDMERDWQKEIWVGKSNFGRYMSPRERATGRLRSEDEMWAPAVIAHPACRCLYSVWHPEFAKYDKHFRKA